MTPSSSTCATEGQTAKSALAKPVVLWMDTVLKTACRSVSSVQLPSASPSATKMTPDTPAAMARYQRHSVSRNHAFQRPVSTR